LNRRSQTDATRFPMGAVPVRALVSYLAAATALADEFDRPLPPLGPVPHPR
jgi:hypothetical protein